MKKIWVGLSLLSLLLNSFFTPAYVIAQELSPTPEPIPIESIEPTLEPTETPTETPMESTTPEPTSEPTPSEIATLVPTPLEEILSPSPTGQAPTQEAIVVSPSATPVITTDKEDYRPGETATISGQFFESLQNLALKVFGGTVEEGNYKVDSYNVTTDLLGSFVSQYVLDNIFRPLYSVEVSNTEGSKIASTTFTDSPICQNDVEGADDEPGQKDLTRMCADYANAPTTVNTNWDWDDISWFGNNTGDACNLFDTDNDGKVNYAICVTIGGSPAVIQSTTIYSCNDNNTDKCSGPTILSVSAGTSCSVSINSLDPFPAGNAYPNDTQGSCNINLADVGGATAKLVDVCSYPSQQPNSDPSDCIVATTNEQTAKLEIIKSLVPSSDPGLFNLSIDNAVLASNVGNNGTTSEQIVLASLGNGTVHTFSESAGTNTSLSNYTTSVVCKEENEAGAVVSTTGSNPWTINVIKDKDIVCTVTNTRINNASLTVIKDAVPNDAQDFSFTTTGTGLSNFSLDDDSDATLFNTKIFSDLAAGTYSVTETVVPGWDLTSVVCSDQSPANAIDLSQGENVVCTFTNTKLGSISGYKYEDINGDGQNISDWVVIPNWIIQLWQEQNLISSTSTDQNGFFSFTNLLNGFYTVKEVVETGWINLTPDSIDVTLDVGENDGQNNFVNFEKASITVRKNVLDEFGNEVVDNQVFQVQINGGNTQQISETGNVTYTDLTPGQYTISELTPPSGYQLVSITNGGIVNVQSGQTYEIDVVNKQLPGSITIVKDAIPNAGFNFNFSGDLGSFMLDDDSNATLSNSTTFSNLGAGTYSLTENAYSAWTLTNLVCVDPDQETIVDISSRNASIDLDFGENITCIFTNSRRPKIKVKKHVINDNGGTKVAGDFTINVNGPNPSYTLFLGSETGRWIYFDPGEYSIDEIEQIGYTKSLSSNCSGTLSYGNSKTCTITNNDQEGTLIIKKIIDGGNKTYTDFSFVVNNDSLVAFENDGQNELSVNAGTYTITEPTVTGYTTTYDNCTEINISNGGSTTCTITNTRDTGEIVVKKIIDEDGDLQTTDDQTPGIDWEIDVDGVSGDADDPNSDSTDLNGEYKTGKIKTGTYSASETQQDGYDLVSAVCSDDSSVNSISIEKDEVVTCSFYNTPNGTIHGYKWNDLDGEGDEDLGENKLGGWTINLYGWDDEDGDYTNFIKSTSTDSNPGADFGWYWFTHLFPGDYKVCEELQNGWQQTYPSGDGCHLEIGRAHV